MFKVNEVIQMENADGMRMTGIIKHITYVDGVCYCIVKLETGITIPFSMPALKEMVTDQWDWVN